MEKPIPMHLWRRWNGGDSTRNRLSLDEFPSIKLFRFDLGKLMCSQRVQIASGSHILAHASFLLLPVKLLSIILSHISPRFDVMHRLVSIERHPASIQPLRHCSSLNGDFFLPKVCTLHSVSPLHLAATTSKVRGGFQRGFLFFFFRGFCLYVLSKWRDCWIAMMI